MSAGHDVDASSSAAQPEGGPRATAPSAFAIAVSVVSLMLLAGAAVGVGVVLGSDHEPTMPAATNAIELASMPRQTAEHYRFAAIHGSVYEQVPCFCGCDAMLGHRSLLDCFVRPEGGWERHASGCAVCLDESRMIRSMLARGSPAALIRSEIVASYTTGM
jgi:hypothetical protein